jgi:hypothetical protein
VSTAPVKHAKRNDFGKAVSRFLSTSPAFAEEGENHLSQQPVPGTRFPCRKHGAGSSGVPYLALHPMGFSVPSRLRVKRWSLTPPFHPYPALPCGRTWRFVFCGTVRRDASRRHLPRVSQRSLAARQVTRHRALWSSDFPPPRASRGSDPPPSQNRFHNTRILTVDKTRSGRGSKAIVLPPELHRDTTQSACIP